MTINPLGEFKKQGALCSLYHRYRNKTIPAGIYLSNYRPNDFAKYKNDILGIRQEWSEIPISIKINYNCLEYRYEIKKTEPAGIIIIVNTGDIPVDNIRYAILYMKDSGKLIGWAGSHYAFSMEPGSSGTIDMEVGDKCILME